MTNRSFIDILDLNKLPNDVNISTMTITCKIDTLFIVDNIGKYFDLIPGEIFGIKYGSLPDTNRFLCGNKTKKKIRKKKKHFYNQVTIIVNSSLNKNINIKLFINGSIQITGCQNIEKTLNAISLLFKYLKRDKAVLDYKLPFKIIDKPFVTNKDILNTSNIYNIKVEMINSNFNIKFKIDRDLLYENMVNDNLECTFDPIIHACVDIKFNYDDKKKISIFIFESGAIIITGANNCDHILEAYVFINKYLLLRYYGIVKNNILENKKVLDLLS
jgi:TATA-box binding protein (TBP) (component of TFIID and TFIIIB)